MPKCPGQIAGATAGEDGHAEHGSCGVTPAIARRVSWLMSDLYRVTAATWGGVDPSGRITRSALQISGSSRYLEVLGLEDAPAAGPVPPTEPIAADSRLIRSMHRYLIGEECL